MTDETAGIGHNSTGADGANSVASDELRQFVERIERLDEEKRALAEDIKDVLAEAKGRGFDTKAIRKIIALRRRDAADVKEENAILELYAQALGLDFLL